MIAVAVRERPILFSGEMVRAILDGRKTQTRRVVNWRLRQEGLNLRFTGLEAGHYCTGDPTSGWVLRSRGAGDCWNDRTYRTDCPYGQLGDRLYVREKFAVYVEEPTDAVRFIYRADPMFDDCGPGDFGWDWKPSIHMPRIASRLTLEIIEVRVQRVQEISGDDCGAEGIQIPVDTIKRASGNDWMRCHYASLWDELNAARGHSWEANPWVWCVTFKRVAS